MSVGHIRRIAKVLLLGGGFASPSIGNAQAPSVTYSQSVERGEDRATGQQRQTNTITVRFSGTPMDSALAQVARLAKIDVSYRRELFAGAKPVTATFTKQDALAVLQQLVQPYGLVINVTSTGHVVIVAATQKTVPQAKGSIQGVVIDSATRQPVPNATVTLAGTSLSAVTTNKGEFAFADVTAGDHRLNVKLFGYRAMAQRVTVVEGKRVTATVLLHAIPTTLSGVVTTATGDRRKVEVGHSIVTINVDSIMQVAPISSVTDLLESRVPGMSVQRTSGTPGDPARIRLRGTSSIYQNNDPIVVVDGVRMYSAQSDDRNVNESGTLEDPRYYASPSPLDQIDPNSIEKIEVLKGPSASALYGSDAANGVILITTKRGQAGPPRWSLSGNAGTTYMPGKWPTSTYQWITPIHGGYPELCIGYCGDATIDSVIHFQAMNNPNLTVLGRGSTLGASATVSGGTQTVTYSFTGTGSRTGGILKLPKVEEERYLKYQGEPAPGWMRRPDMLENRGVQGRVQVQLARDASITVGSSLNQQTQRRTSMSSSTNSAIDMLQRMWVDESQLSEKPLLGNPYERVVVAGLNLVNDIQLNVKPASWLPITGTFGMNSLTQSSEMSIARGLLTTVESGGVWRGSTKVASGITGNAYTTVPILRRVTLSGGVNFDRGRTNDQSGSMFGIPIDVSDPSAGQDTARNQFSRNTSERRSFGWFLEPRLNFQSRFFVMPGFRLDNNGLAGKNAKFNGLPKMSFSWLASEESFFPWKQVIGSFRLRSAFGVSGVQPRPGDQYRLYKRVAVTPYTGTDTLYGEMLSLNYLGNTRLRPERGVEMEGGFDAELWNNRLNLDMTYWKKKRMDAIVDNNYGTSVDGGGTIRMNVGDIDNFGTEISIQAQLLERRAIGASVNVSFTRQQSRVLRLRDDGLPVRLSVPYGVGYGNDISYVVGYPVEGKWMKPILGYRDLDGDGWLSRGEIIVDAEDRYVGSTEPAYQLAMNPGVTFLGGRVSAMAAISFIRGQMQTLNNAGGFRAERGWYPWESDIVEGPTGFDRYAALACVRNAVCAQQTYIGFMQKVDMLRWREMSINVNLGERAARFVRARRVSLALQGSNVALWTNYVGVDPNVNAFSGARGLSDSGQQPQPREWRFRMMLDY